VTVPRFLGELREQRWMADASCIDVDDPELFFPEGFETKYILPMVVDRYCSGCPVAGECFDYGRRTAAGGIWGGMYIDSRQRTREPGPRTLDEARRRLRRTPKEPDTEPAWLRRLMRLEGR
jgi:hypothetical protein